MKNLGVFFDKTLTMEKQVSSVSKSCFLQIRNIGRIRSYITDDACKTLVNSLVISRLDYGNALLYGVNANILSQLQRIQNTAARLISRKHTMNADLTNLPQVYGTVFLKTFDMCNQLSFSRNF